MLYVMVRRRVVILSPRSSVVWLPSIASQSRALWTRVLRLLDCSPEGSGLVEAFSRFNGNLYLLQQQSLLAPIEVFLICIELQVWKAKTAQYIAYISYVVGRAWHCSAAMLII